MNRFLNFTKNFLITAAILVCGFLLSLFMQKEWGNQTLIPSIFLLDVFLVSVITDGFLYGAVASVISILAVNYAFTFPYFKINFTIPENMISAVIMIAIAVITCGFTNKLKSQEQLKAESEQEKRRANLLRSVSHDFRTPLTTIYGASSAMLDDKNEFTEEQKKSMLRGIKQYAAEQNIRCEISLEEKMACGVGACLACVCQTKNVDKHSKVHNARICADGPAFYAEEVEL